MKVSVAMGFEKFPRRPSSRLELVPETRRRFKVGNVLEGWSAIFAMTPRPAHSRKTGFGMRGKIGTKTESTWMRVAAWLAVIMPVHP